MRIKSYKQFKDFVGGYPKSGKLIYRGIGSQFGLLPSISYNMERDGIRDIDILYQRGEMAQRMFNDRFRKDFPNRMLTNYQLVFLARHYKLISSFMDFTFNDTIAIQFGMEMAQDNAVHLFAMDITGERTFREEDGLPENIAVRIYQPNLVWNQDGFLTGERTKFIQNARLVTQERETITTPFNGTFSDRITHYEIFPEDFNGIIQEIEQEGTRMAANLFIDSDDPLFEIAKQINEEILR